MAAHNVMGIICVGWGSTVEPQSVIPYKSTSDLKTFKFIFHCLGLSAVFLNRKSLL